MVKLRHRKSILMVLIFLGFFILGFSFSIVYLSNPELCQQQHTSPQLSIVNPELSVAKEQTYLLVVVIFSAPVNNDRRQVIRETWLQTKGKLNIRHYFVIASASLSAKEKKTLQTENSHFGDLLILEKMSDSFSKLSLKLLETFRWLDSHVDFTFMLKVDDDSFVRLDALHSKMVAQHKERLYWGFFDGQARVKKRGKWQEKSWFLCDRYLPYAKGGGYVLTRDLVKQVVLMSELLFMYQNEDVALGTWLSPFHIRRLHDPQFDTEFLSRGCDNSYLVTHKQSTTMMISKYNNILKFGKFCLSEYKSRNSYVYNWEVPPSLCCNRNDSTIP